MVGVRVGVRVVGVLLGEKEGIRVGNAVGSSVLRLRIDFLDAVGDRVGMMDVVVWGFVVEGWVVGECVGKEPSSGLVVGLVEGGPCTGVFVTSNTIGAGERRMS